MSDETCNTDSRGPQLVCTLDTFTSEQRRRHEETAQTVFAAVQQVQELADGYRFQCPPESELLLAMAEFVALERCCCPFFDFAIQVERKNGPLWLQMTGPIGTKELLRTALPAFSSYVAVDEQGSGIFRK